MNFVFSNRAKAVTYLLMLIAGFNFFKRASQPEEQAHLIVFLASDAASFMTGQTYTNDAGQTAH